jgi:flavin reductase (DIM6/NTAB) family NADH-FMN oxidoreductase RutF
MTSEVSVSEIFGRMGGPRDDANGEEVGPQEIASGARGGRWLRRQIAGSVAALTTIVDGSYRASTITAFCLISTDPVQLLVSVELDSQMEGWLRSSGIFGLSMLPYSEQFLADRLAGVAPLVSRTFADIPHLTSVTGAPLLARSLAWADCEIKQSIEAGDHTLFVGKAIAVGRGELTENDPLLYYLNRYRTLR